MYTGTTIRRETFLNILRASFALLYASNVMIFGQEHEFSLRCVWRSYKNIVVDVVQLFIGGPLLNESYKVDPFEVLETQRQLRIR